MEVSGQLQDSAALLPRKGPPVPIGEETGNQSWSGRGGKEKKNSFFCRESNPDRPPCSLVTIMIIMIINLRGVGCEDEKWMKLAQSRVQWQAFALLNLRVLLPGWWWWWWWWRHRINFIFHDLRSQACNDS